MSNPKSGLADNPLFKRATPPPPKVERQAEVFSSQALTDARMYAYMHETLTKKASYSYAFRYPPELLEKLDEMLEKVKALYKLKLPKNPIAVLALAYFLWDFEEHQEESLFYKFLLKKEK
jgi:hypothetical protein